MPTPITASTLSALLSAALAQTPTRPLVLALDGRCGSGKSGLGDLMGRLLPCNVVHMDDYYLPPDPVSYTHLTLPTILLV